MNQQPIKELQAKSLVGLHNMKDKMKLDPHLHENYEIYYSVSGGHKFYIDNQIYDMFPGDLFIIPPEKVHVCTTHIGEKYQRYILFAHPNILKPMTDNETDLAELLEKISKQTHKVHLNAEQHKKMISLYEKFLSCNGYCKDMLKYSIAIEILVFACFLFENNKGITCDNQLEENNINTIINFIEKNLDGDLSLDNIEKSLGMKKKSINTIFKATTNTTVYSYIVNRRIAEAKKLLLENFSLVDVCKKTGFKNYTHFGRTFITLVGKSPKQYQSSFLKTSNHLKLL